MRESDKRLARVVAGAPWPSFWERVRVTPDCWEWTAGLNHSGYGLFVFAHAAEVLAHRASKAMALGWAFPSTIFALHRCDNRRCVRPDHLFLGDKAANFQDMIDKRRHHFGERSPQSKLLERDVLDIRSRRALGERPADLAKEYRVNPSTISNIVARRDWTHI